MRKNIVSPHDALRLMKQPRGDTRSAVRSADYMAQTLRLLQERMHHVHKRSVNATGKGSVVLERVKTVTTVKLSDINYETFFAFFRFALCRGSTKTC